LFLLLIFFGLLLIRKPKENSDPIKKQVKKFGDSSQDEIDEILNRIFTERDHNQIPKKPSKKKVVKKKVVKKATKKVAKKSAKKPPVKKAPTKKK